MEDKLDDFFKNKLEEREIVFNEAHWEQAQFMLDMQDEKKRRRAWWQYWTLALLGLILFGTFAWCSMETYDGMAQNLLTLEKTEDENSILCTDNEIDKKSENMLYVSENEITNFTKKQNNQQKEQTFSNKKENDKKAATQNNLIELDEKINSYSNFKTKTTTQTKEVKTQTNKQKTPYQQGNKQDNNNQIQEQQATENLSKKETKTTTNSKVSEDIESFILPMTAEKNANNEQETKNTTENEATTISTEIISSSEEILFATKVEKKNSEEKARSVQTEKEGFIVVKNLFKNIKSIPTSYTLLDYPTKVLGDAVPTIAPPTTEPLVQKGWRLGITASALLYPFSNTSELQFSEFPDINPAVTAQQWVGFKIGAIANYHFNYRWAIRTGLLYYKQTGTFQSVKSSRQVSYRFGLESTTFDLVPQSLHYIECPILVTRKYAKHALELGTAFDFLVGVNNTIGIYENIGDDEIVLASQKSSWQYQDGFSRLHIRALLGYKYQVFKSLEVGLRANYTLGSGILDKNYSPISNTNSRFILLESRPINLELKMTYYW